jgi:hypothetical protein
MLSVGAVPPTEEAIQFHVMSDCSSVNVDRQMGGICGQSECTISVPARIVTHTHTHTHTHTRTQSSLVSEYVMPR